MIKVKVTPPKLFLFSWLSTKAVKLVEEEPNILHYCGDNEGELRSLIRTDKPDLLVNHSFPSFNLEGTFHVYHPVKDEGGLYQAELWTDNEELARTYYQTLGLPIKISVYKTKKKSSRRQEVNFQGIRGAVTRTWTRVKTTMDWD
jgi:hypothetical protein